ncbi:MAG: SPOR domain-containing protein [Candidatus Rokubacteria bacterium]|nr:SPOR domain-containing protein [Candidatus Rokubacteria bacterium]
MSTEHDDERMELQDNEEWEEPPTPFLARTWVRVALVVVVIGAIAAVSAPFVMDALNPPAPMEARPSAPPAQAPAPPAVPEAEKKPDAPATTAPATAPAPAPTGAPAAQEQKAASPSAKKTGASSPTAALRQPKQEPKRAAAAVEKREEPKAAKRAEPGPEKAAAAAKSSTATQPKFDAPKTAADRRAAAGKTVGGETGDFWVQVGAFRDAETAKRVAARLEQRSYRVEQSTTTRGPARTKAAAPAAASGTAGGASGAAGDRYDVFVASTTPAQVVSKLNAKGLSAEGVSDGALVKPSLPLRDAVALSKDLASEGFKVQVRRARGASAGGTAPAAPAPAVATAATTGTLHRVRVGAFTDRATALAALKNLEAEGFKPFIAKEPK